MSQGRGRTDSGIVRRPRHFLIYRTETDVTVVGRVLHDAMDDPYLRERKHDVLQVVARVSKALDGRGLGRPEMRGGAGRILIATDLSPADVLQYRHDDPAQAPIAAFWTEYGGRTSHTAILARSMDVPAVVGVPGALERIVDDDWIIIDGDAGVVIVAPDEDVLEYYRTRVQTQVAEPYRRRGVTAVGGTRVLAPDELLDMLAEGGSGYHFFGKTVERVTLRLKP